MRPLIAILLTSIPVWAQFKSTVPLVAAPTTIVDAKGRYVDGLTTDDLILYDNNVPQKIQMDGTLFPISLVVAVQTSENSGAVIDKLGRLGILLTELIAAEAGETAMISFSRDVRVHQEFTHNSGLITHSLQMLRKEGGAAHMLDALDQAVGMLEKRPASRRRIVLMIAERRDRDSTIKLPEVAEKIQRANVTVYWLTYSPFLQPFTVKAKTKEDLKPEAERIKGVPCALCPQPDHTPVPADIGPASPMYAIGELIRLHQPDLANLFTSTTGGRELSFLKKDALEEAVQLVGAEVHRQYILSFEPKSDSEPGSFHRIRITVNKRSDLQAKTRAGYWSLP